MACINKYIIPIILIIYKFYNRHIMANDTNITISAKNMFLSAFSSYNVYKIYGIHQ